VRLQFSDELHVPPSNAAVSHRLTAAPPTVGAPASQESVTAGHAPHGGRMADSPWLPQPRQSRVLLRTFQLRFFFFYLFFCLISYVLKVILGQSLHATCPLFLP